MLRKRPAKSPPGLTFMDSPLSLAVVANGTGDHIASPPDRLLALVLVETG